MQFGRFLLDLNTPKIMGVLNTTPDSFSDGGSLHTRDGRLEISRVLQRVETMLEEGADIIDVGGESTRPGATAVAEDEELRRVVPVVAAIAHRFDVPVSVDTSTAQVIQAAADAGASLINDVRALRRPGALEAVANTGLPVCLMHMAGEPEGMQDNPEYRNIIDDVRAFLLERIAACDAAGIPSERILIDPGFGFGKTLAHNLELFRNLPELQKLGRPLLIGVSRKSMIGAILDKPVSQRMVGSVAMAMLAAQRGVAILRVHDVSATADAFRIRNMIEG